MYFTTKTHVKQSILWSILNQNKAFVKESGKFTCKIAKNRGKCYESCNQLKK